MVVQRIGTFACEDCGDVVTRRKRADKSLVCLPCGERRAIDHVARARAAKGLDREGWLEAVRIRRQVATWRQ